MRTKRHDFPGAHGHPLAARIEAPDDEPHAYALYAHCFTCGKDMLTTRHITHELTAHGIAVMRFDFTGIGASGGDFADTNFSTNIDDLLAAADYLRTHFTAPQLLIGHSLGGTAMLAAAEHIPEARAVVTIASPGSPAFATSTFSEHLERIARDGEADVKLAGRPFRIRQQFVDDAGTHSLRDKIAGLRKALLVMHAPGDDTVPISHAMDIFAPAKHPKSFVSLDDADHLLTRREDAAYAAKVIAAWSRRYLDQ
jgi:putative redox protein